MKQNSMVYLASGSPRRKELLEQLGFEFEVIVSDFDEKLIFSCGCECESTTEKVNHMASPAETVRLLAFQKANVVAERLKKEGKFEDTYAHPKVNQADEKSVKKPDKKIDEKILNKSGNKFRESPIVIGSDTVVALDGKIFGKPQSEEEAVDMLMQLSGRKHQVFTGVAVIPVFTDRNILFYEKSDVCMFDFSLKEAIAYVRSGEPMDKAGSYGIQGKGAALVKEIHGDYNTIVGLPLAKLVRELALAGYVNLER